ncbi:hypothetical protein BDV36DRAFT_276610 [Aspergillus pseudocaelatus]|uniref:Uncharacterized protein n=1 Tax=Aspergillus pseudocaelatus TaxID=1825620 RepID=A0ABQ6W113_9EURO|nr:hypothetical protein BDV36DRAFT_276610 [Aspergillus pseudocaelatus]
MSARSIPTDCTPRISACVQRPSMHCGMPEDLQRTQQVHTIGIIPILCMHMIYFLYRYLLRVPFTIRLTIRAEKVQEEIN